MRANKYKITHSADDRHRVYRKFKYTPKLRLDFRTAAALTAALAGIAIIVPTPSDAIIFSAISGYYVGVFDVPFITGVAYAAGTYKGVGVALLVSGLIFGGLTVRRELKKHVSKQVEKNIQRVRKLRK